MGEKKRIYLAGPEVFLPDALDIGQRKKTLCSRYGFEGLFPFDNKVPPGPGADRVIYSTNMAMIRGADLGIFNLTPFRGPSADVGTVFELGAMIGLGKPVYGYTHEAADLLGRMRAAGTARLDPATGLWRDVAGLEIEDFGNADNLMIDAALAAQSHPMIRMAVAAESPIRSLAGFEACLQRARQDGVGEPIGLHSQPARVVP